MSTEIDAEIVATCEAAATYLGEHGLTKAEFVNYSNQACLSGALAIADVGLAAMRRYPNALRDSLDRCPAIPAVIATIRELHPARVAALEVVARLGNPTATPSTPVWIYKFNDHPDTTQDDVVEVLRETIKRHTADEYRSDGAP